MVKDNKIVDAYLEAALRAQLATGHWPETKFKQEHGITSFSLFDYAAVNNQWRLCVHVTLVENGYADGIYTAKRSRDWETLVGSLISRMRPATTADLVRGRRVAMHNPFGKGQRWATVAEKEYMPCIFDVHVEERNGCFEETGSAYVWEVEAVRIDGIWCPFEMTPEERAAEKETQGINIATAKVMDRFTQAAGI